MISVLASTGTYILQPSLVEMHQNSMNWFSALELWKTEINFFQKLLDQHTTNVPDTDGKKQVDHFQHLITYYGGEVLPLLRKKLKDHEHSLARMLKELNETDTEYFKEHQALMEELAAFQKTFYQFKQEYIQFVERGFSPYALK